MKLNNWFNNKKSTLSTSVRALEPMLIQRFKRMLHTQQLDIFINVLQLSLVNLQDTLTRVVLGKNEYGQRITLFDKKLDELYHGILTLNTYLGKDGSWESSPRRNLLLTIFVFYRILFRDLLTHISPLKPDPSAQDSYILIKRIPPQVIYQAGAEYWRLYELSTIIYGEPLELRLNHDLIPILMNVFSEDNHNDTHSSECFIAENEDSLQPATGSNSDEMNEQASQFIAWLELNMLREESGFELNQERIFVDTLHFDNDVVFITDEVLKSYPESTPEVLLTNLTGAQRILENAPDKRYCIQGKNFSLLGLRIDNPIDGIDMAELCVVEPLSK